MTMLLAGLAVAGLPLLASQQPAGATTTTDTKSGSLMFVDFNGHFESCTLTNQSTHDTDDPNHPTAKVTGSTSNGCTGPMSLTINFTDKDGAKQSVTTSSGNDSQSITAVVSGATTSVTTTASVTFNGCDVQQCSLQVSAAPK
ncbi:MAG: hypothetical protein M3Z46_01905 [Actinomycetota bacterium]|nr:hypothetical protein [Actinomycetota bacterium]